MEFHLWESVYKYLTRKTVLLPDVEADCPMAHMASIEKIEEIKANNEDVAVVCYVNSTAKLKSYSDVV